MNTDTPPRAINPRPNMTRRQSESYWAKMWKAEVMEKRRLAAEVDRLHEKLNYGGDLPLWRIIANRIARRLSGESR